MAKKKAFLLRMSPELWDEISRWAADEFRSVNGHIEYVLRRAVVEEGRRGGERPFAGGSPGGKGNEEPPGSASRGAGEDG